MDRKIIITAVVGVDGVGKTTYINKLKEQNDKIIVRRTPNTLQDFKKLLKEARKLSRDGNVEILLDRFTPICSLAYQTFEKKEWDKTDYKEWFNLIHPMPNLEFNIILLIDDMDNIMKRIEMRGDDLLSKYTLHEVRQLLTLVQSAYINLINSLDLVMRSFIQHDHLSVRIIKQNI